MIDWLCNQIVNNWSRFNLQGVPGVYKSDIPANMHACGLIVIGSHHNLLLDNCLLKVTHKDIKTK